MVGIAYALVQFVQPLVGESVAIPVGDIEGVMGREREHSGQERLGHLAELGGEELQERLVPYAPLAVKLLHPSETFVGHELVLAEILLEPYRAHEGVESQRLVVCSVEECRPVAQVACLGGERVEVVERVG